MRNMQSHSWSELSSFTRPLKRPVAKVVANWDLINIQSGENKIKEENEIRDSYKAINFTPNQTSSFNSPFKPTFLLQSQLYHRCQHKYKNQGLAWGQLPLASWCMVTWRCARSWTPAATSTHFNSVWIAAQDNLLLCFKIPDVLQGQETFQT